MRLVGWCSFLNQPLLGKTGFSSSKGLKEAVVAEVGAFFFDPLLGKTTVLLVDGFDVFGKAWNYQL